MARGKSSSSDGDASAFPIENASDPLGELLQPLPPLVPLQPFSDVLLNEIDDGRLWSPPRTPDAALSLSGRPALVEAAPPPSSTAAIRYADPARAVVCVRRSVRREVLHALRLTGKGAGARRRRKSRSSNIRC